MCASSEHGPTCVLRFAPFACRSQMEQSITKAVALAVVAADPIKSVFHLFWFVHSYSLSYACHIVKAPNPCRQQMHNKLILNRSEPHRSRWLLSPAEGVNGEPRGWDFSIYFDDHCPHSAFFNYTVDCVYLEPMTPAATVPKNQHLLSKLFQQAYLDTGTERINCNCLRAF